MKPDSATYRAPPHHKHMKTYTIFEQIPKLMIPNKLTDQRTNRLTNSHSKCKAMLIKLCFGTATIHIEPCLDLPISIKAHSLDIKITMSL